VAYALDLRTDNLDLRTDNKVVIMSSQQDSQGGRRTKVIRSLEDADGFRCVDIFERPDGSYGFKEFRRDPEDAGRWTLVGDYSHHSHATTDDALRVAATSIPWLAASIKSKSR
jgi:hypothetical protein